MTAFRTPVCFLVNEGDLSGENPIGTLHEKMYRWKGLSALLLGMIREGQGREEISIEIKRDLDHPDLIKVWVSRKGAVR